MQLSSRSSSNRGAVKRWLAPFYRSVCTVSAPLRVSQRARRALVAVYAAVLAAFPLLGIWTGEMAFVLIMFAPFVAASLLLAGSTHGLLDRPQHALDERQLNVRRTIFREPYLTGVAVGLAGGVAVTMATRASDPVMMGWMLLVASAPYGLPSMLLAWRMPDDPDDDGE